LWAVIGALSNRIVDIRYEIGEFADVIVEHGFKVGVKPLSAFLHESFGGDHVEFANVIGGFDGMAPWSVEEDVADGFLFGFGDGIVCFNVEVQGFFGESNDRDRSDGGEVLIILADECGIRFVSDGAR